MSTINTTRTTNTTHRLEHLSYSRGTLAAMGQNRRYDMVSADIARWERQQALRPTPIGLTIEQVGNRRQDAVTPVPVAAWVPHHVAYVEQQVLHGVAVAWTKDAVLVRYPTDHGDAHVWVWASAVTRTDTPNRRGAE